MQFHLESVGTAGQNTWTETKSLTRVACFIFSQTFFVQNMYAQVVMLGDCPGMALAWAI